MSVVDAVKLGMEVLKLGKDVAPLVADLVSKAKQISPDQARRIAFDKALALMDEEILKDEFARKQF